VDLLVIIWLRFNFCMSKLSRADDWVSNIPLNNSAYSEYDSFPLLSGNMLLIGTLADLRNTNMCRLYFLPSWTLVLYASIACITYLSQSCFCDPCLRYSINVWWERSINLFNWSQYAMVLYLDILYLCTIWCIMLLIKFGPWSVIYAFGAVYAVFGGW